MGSGGNTFLITYSFFGAWLVARTSIPRYARAFPLIRFHQMSLRLRTKSPHTHDSPDSATLLCLASNIRCLLKDDFGCTNRGQLTPFFGWKTAAIKGRRDGGRTAVGNIYCAVGPLQDMRASDVISLIQLYDPPASHGLSSLPRLAFAQTRAQSLSRASTTQQCEPSAKWH